MPTKTPLKTPTNLEFNEVDTNLEELQVISLFDAPTLGCKILLRYDPDQAPMAFTVTKSFPKPHSITKNRVDPYLTLEEAKQEYLLLHEAELQSQEISPDEDQGEFGGKTIDELQVMLADRQSQVSEAEEALADGSVEDPDDERALIADLKKDIEEIEENIKNMVLSSKGIDPVEAEKEGELEELEPDLSI